MIAYLIVGGVLLLFVVYLFIKAGKYYKEYIDAYEEHVQLAFMLPAALYLIDRYRLMERMRALSAVIQQKMISLHGNKESLEHTKLYIAQLISIVLLCLVGSLLFTILAEGDHAMLFVGLMFSAVIPVAMVKKLEAREKERRQSILTELPEFVNKVVLLVNAGETVQQAIVHCVRMKKDIDNSPLYVELLEVVNKMTSNQPFSQALEDLNKRCSMQEVSILTTTILLNYRKGGSDLVLALRELSHDLWEKRKMISKTMGEEASSKLVFPMVFIFIAVLLIIGWPALSVM